MDDVPLPPAAAPCFSPILKREALEKYVSPLTCNDSEADAMTRAEGLRESIVAASVASRMAIFRSRESSKKTSPVIAPTELQSDMDVQSTDLPPFALPPSLVDGLNEYVVVDTDFPPRHTPSPIFDCESPVSPRLFQRALSLVNGDKKDSGDLASKLDRAERLAKFAAESGMGMQYAFDENALSV